jgi:hypothetical protein
MVFIPWRLLIKAKVNPQTLCQLLMDQLQQVSHTILPVNGLVIDITVDISDNRRDFEATRFVLNCIKFGPSNCLIRVLGLLVGVGSSMASL